MMNIILNAIQAIEDGGVVDVVTRRFVKEKSHFVQIEVRDSGVGIPEKDLENIFNPFFTTKDDGVGLGLAISNQIIQEHGGYLALESRVGQGTAFFINLPFGEENRGPESQ
jgi:signal transduction histidine kinase